jgi:hypothetical protein
MTQFQIRNFSVFCLLVLLFTAQFACGLLTTQPTPVSPTAEPATPTPTTGAGQLETPVLVETPPAETPVSGSLSLEMLKNFTFHLEDFNAQAALEQGVFSDDMLQVRLIEPVAFGDLNGDGQPDAAVILAIQSGGSGTFYDLIALLDQDGRPVQSGSAFVGDRQVVKNLEIAGGRLILDYLTQGLDDPLCCPSERRLRSYLLENGVLRLAGEQVLDSPEEEATPLPNAILIDQPATGDTLTSPQQVSGRVSQVPPEKKLAYYVTDFNATLLLEGEVPLEGDPGGPGVFAFEFDLSPVPTGLIQVEVVDSAGGALRGRSAVVLVVP